MATCLEYNEERTQTCDDWEDQGYNDCASWDPWFAWLCIGWTWVSHLVCVGYTWTTTAVCVLWDTTVTVVDAIIVTLESIGLGWILNLLAALVGFDFRDPGHWSDHSVDLECRADGSLRNPEHPRHRRLCGRDQAAEEVACLRDHSGRLRQAVRLRRTRTW